jgi:mono/diheme cytochrome c family protein
MLDPFKEGLVATGKEEQTITDQQVQEEVAAQFPSDQGREMVLTECSGCHSLQVILEQQKSKSEWKMTALSMLGEADQNIDEIVGYLSKHFGR